MADLKKLFENYLKSSYRTTPVRSPFSQTNYYHGGQVSGSSGSWLDLTELYNTTYRTHYQENGFDKVMYNEPLNIMVAWPKDDAEAFDHIDEDCVTTFGLKTARGFKKDYRFIDMSTPGAGRVAMSEEDAEQIIDEPFKSLREVRPEYTRSFGETPIERIDESAKDNTTLNIQRKLHEIIREEVDNAISDVCDHSDTLDLDEKDNATVRRALRKIQLDENLPRFMDAMIDNCAKKLRENRAVSDIERLLVEEAVTRLPSDNLSKDLQKYDNG